MVRMLKPEARSEICWRYLSRMARFSASAHCSCASSHLWHAGRRWPFIIVSMVSNSILPSTFQWNFSSSTALRFCAASKLWNTCSRLIECVQYNAKNETCFKPSASAWSSLDSSPWSSATRCRRKRKMQHLRSQSSVAPWHGTRSENLVWFSPGWLFKKIVLWISGPPSIQKSRQGEAFSGVLCANWEGVFLRNSPLFHGHSLPHLGIVILRQKTQKLSYSLFSLIKKSTIFLILTCTQLKLILTMLKNSFMGVY